MKLSILFPILFLITGCATTTHVNMDSVGKPLHATGKVINAAIKKQEQIKKDDAVKLKADLKKMDIILAVAKRDYEKTLVALEKLSAKVDKLTEERDNARENELEAEKAKWFWIKIAAGSALSALGSLAWASRGLIAKAVVLAGS